MPGNRLLVHSCGFGVRALLLWGTFRLQSPAAPRALAAVTLPAPPHRAVKGWSPAESIVPEETES